MRIFVSGGCGFVGASLVKKAVEKGHHVFNIDLKNTAQIAPQLAPVKSKENYSQLIGNVTDRIMLAALMKEFKPDAFIHCAGGVTQKNGTPNFQGSEATLGILNAVKIYVESLNDEARNAFKFIIPFNTLVYGPLTGSKVEFDTHDSLSSSSVSTARAVMDLILANAWSAETGIPVIYCGASALYGPHLSYDNLIPTLVKNASKEAITKVLDPNNSYDWLHVEDYTSGLLAAAHSGVGNETYLFSARAERRNIDIATNAMLSLDGLLLRDDGRSHIQFIQEDTSSSISPYRCALNAGKAERELNWFAKHNLLMGLRDTVSYYLPEQFSADTKKAANSNQTIRGLAAE